MSGVPFAFFCSLLHEISTCPPQKTKFSVGKWPAPLVVRRWIHELRARFSPLPQNTPAVFLCLFFPEEDSRRKYGMQEAALANALADALSLNASSLKQWNHPGSSGCLGRDVKVALERLCLNENSHDDPFTIDHVHRLLDELSSHSGFSDIRIRQIYAQTTRRSRCTILRDLFSKVSPRDASFLVQIILKDLHPLLYHLPEKHYTAALGYDRHSFKALTKEHVMKIWDPSGFLLQTYRMRADFDDAVSTWQNSGNNKHVSPAFGTPIEIPKSQKGRGCRHALFLLQLSKKVWAETKYDGERAQIHVNVRNDGTSQILIFSKSKRDSTGDRQAIHSIIRKCLGLPQTSGGNSGLHHTGDIILDAEMVAWDGGNIDDFWRIREIIEHTALGIRRKYKPESHSHLPLTSQKEYFDGRCLGLVFFDVLMYDSTSLLTTSYVQRRAILESIICPIQGRVMVSERACIDMTIDETHATLLNVFADHIANHQEGLVLKAEESLYNDDLVPWVKMKKDYIEGYGDTVDLTIIGAGWDKDRARELGVPPTVFTTFYVGALTNAQEMTTTVTPTERPHFLVYFTASYGLSRCQLEEANFLIKNAPFMTYGVHMETAWLPYTFTMFTGLQSLPMIMLRTPLLAEAYGAGFTKASQSEHYELRFPRLTKIYREADRSWTEAVNLQTLDSIARESTGKDRPDKDLDDWCNGLWGKSISPKVKSSPKRKAVIDTWHERLSMSDRGHAASSKKRKIMVTSLQTLPSSFHTQGRQSRSVRNPFIEIGLPYATTTNPKVPGQSLIPPRSVSGVLNATVGVDDNTLQRHDNDSGIPESKEDTFDQALVWFARPPSSYHVPRCKTCIAWRGEVPRPQRIHSLELFFRACGWDETGGMMRHWVRRGIIVMDDHDKEGVEWKTFAQSKLESRVDNFNAGNRRPIWVFDTTIARDTDLRSAKSCCYS